MKITAIAIALLVLIGASAPTSASERHYGLRATGTTAEDLLAEMRRQVPLKEPDFKPHTSEAYDYVVLQGTVVQESLGRSVDCQNYDAWAEFTIRVDKVEYLAATADTSTSEEIVLVARHAPYRDDEGRAVKVSYGAGSERHNRLQPGDRAIMVAVRFHVKEYSTVLYCPEFWPRYSLMYSALIQPESDPASVCVVCSSEIDTARGVDWSGVPWTLLSQGCLGRDLHCYDVSAARAFDLVLEAVRDGAIQR